MPNPSAPKVNPTTRHPSRVQSVGTINVRVTGDADVAKVLNQIHTYVRRVDRFGVVQVNVDGKPAKRKKTAEEALLD